MTTSLTAEPPAIAPPVDAGDRIAHDLPCACGYNLRGLVRDGRCPECNEAVTAALRWHAHPFGGPAPVRRMVQGLALVLAAHVAWGMLMAYVGIDQSGDRYAYQLTGASGPKTFIVAPAMAFARSQIVSRALVPASLAGSLVGLWLLTTPHAYGRRTSLRRAGLTLRWAAIAVVVGAFAALLPSNPPQAMLGWTSVADAVVGALWGIYLAGVGRTLGRATWLHVGGWVVAAGSLVCGGSFACTFILFRPTWRYWETWLWTSLTAWAVVGLFCSALLIFAYRRLRRELREALPATALPAPI